jgi:hypothetical protein
MLLRAFIALVGVLSAIFLVISKILQCLPVSMGSVESLRLIHDCNLKSFVYFTQVLDFHPPMS